MIERITELQDALTRALIDKGIPILSPEDWTICKGLSVVLKPFVQGTKLTSAVKYVIKVVKTWQPFWILDLYYENFKMKKRGKVKEHCLNLVAKELEQIITQDSQSEVQPQLEDHGLSTRTEFDKVVSTRKLTSAKMSISAAEVSRYLEKNFLYRDQGGKHFRFSNLCKLVKGNFDMLAPFLLCERFFFSKAGCVETFREEKGYREKSSSKFKTFTGTFVFKRE
ncbi:hypothetical protein NPIL_368111 [Nephila pilipes]|uniref:Uncharacterized protein n=1 Tax=Nephila pilipes TaxID=299642 RepID=A0A8X6QZ42_NEPPI|nr:hypothetical protein NPIL_368111 [Nephila pilipes]